MVHAGPSSAHSSFSYNHWSYIHTHVQDRRADSLSNFMLGCPISRRLPRAWLPCNSSPGILPPPPVLFLRFLFLGSHSPYLPTPETSSLSLESSAFDWRRRGVYR